MSKISKINCLLLVIAVCCMITEVVSAAEDDIPVAMWKCDDMAPPTCDLHVDTDVIETSEGLHMQYWIYSPIVEATNNDDALGASIIILQGGPGLSHEYNLMLRVLACPELYGSGSGSGVGRKVIFYDPVGTGLLGSALPNNTSIDNDYPFLLDINYRAKEVQLLVDTVLPNGEPYHIIGDSCGTQTAMEYATSKFGNDDVDSGRLLSFVFNGPIPKMADFYGYQLDENNGTIGRMPHYFQKRWKELADNSNGDYYTIMEDAEFQAMSDIMYGMWNYRSGIFPDCALPSFASVNVDIFVGMEGFSDYLPSTGTLKDFDMYPRLHKLDTIPFLLTYGEYDIIHPKTIEKMNIALPLSETYLFKDSGHGTIGDATQDVLKSASNFIYRVENSVKLGEPFIPNTIKEKNKKTSGSFVSVFTVNIVLTVFVSIGIGYILGSQHEKIMKNGSYEQIE